MFNQRCLKCFRIFVTLILLLAALPACAGALTWPDIEARAKGQTVDWFMWGGFPAANANGP